MNEFELIARLTQSLPTNGSVRTGTGDDCAVLDLGIPGRLVLFKTDAVVEGIHFTAETPPESSSRSAPAIASAIAARSASRVSRTIGSRIASPPLSSTSAASA